MPEFTFFESAKIEQKPCVKCGSRYAYHTVYIKIYHDPDTYGKTITICHNCRHKIVIEHEKGK